MDILIAESLARVRYALTILIQKEEGWRVLGWVQNANDLTAKLPGLHPEVLILDWNLSGMSAELLAGDIRRDMKSGRILVVSADPDQRQDALRAGADFFISMIDTPDSLFEILKKCQKYP